MNTLEAIEVIKGYKRLDEMMKNTNRLPACDMAIVALEKQTLKKVPDIEHFGRCPGCDGEFDSELLNEYNIEYCPWCGQRLDWSQD